MKISNQKTTATVGRPSVRSCTMRRSDKHVTFSVKTALELGINAGDKVQFVTKGKDTYLCLNAVDGLTVFGYRNGQRYTSFAVTAKNLVPGFLNAVNAEKVASFMIAANSSIIDGKKAYKVISIPLRID